MRGVDFKPDTVFRLLQHPPSRATGLSYPARATCPIRPILVV